MARAAAKPLLTLTEVATRTKISMPTLQRYKKLYQNRIPSVGQGRKQRYPEEAIPVFLQLKKENIGRRGRPRKNAPRAEVAAPKAASKPAKKAMRSKKPRARKPAAKSGEGLLTLTQVAQMTGISYPTLLRYVKTNIKSIPHKGTGRARRFEPGAVAVFKDLRKRSKRGRKPKAKPGRPGRPPAAKAAAKPTGRRRGRPPKVIEPAELQARIKELEKGHNLLMREIARMQKQLAKPIRLVAKR